MSQTQITLDAPQPPRGVGELEESGLRSNTFVSLPQTHIPEADGWVSPRAQALRLPEEVDAHDEGTWTDATKSRDGSEANDEYRWTGATTPNDIDTLDETKLDDTVAKNEVDTHDAPRPDAMTVAKDVIDTINFGMASATKSKNDTSVHDNSMWSDIKEKTIRGPYDYVTAKPGKEFRTLLLHAFNVWLKVSPESLNYIANVIRMLHNASLLVDDIQDNSTLRRGLPVAHNIFGVAQTINSANYVYFLALAELKKLKNFPQAIEVFTTEMLALHRGQGMDLFWRDTLSCPTEEDYLEMISNKTGGLFRLAVKLLQAESDTDVDCMPFVDVLGLIFQITDDYKNLSNPDYADLKGYCEDLTEGKFSFPVIHSIHAQPSNQELLHILSKKPTEFEIKRHAVECMERTGSFAYTRQVVDDLVAKARAVSHDLDVQCGSNNSEAFFRVVEKIAKI